MEVRDELKELIEKAKLAAVESGELPKGDYPPVQRLELSPKKFWQRVKITVIYREMTRKPFSWNMFRQILPVPFI